MTTTSVENVVKEVLITEAQIAEAVTRIAAEITEDHKNSDKKLLVVCILKGSLMFTTELMKKIPLHVEVDFMKVSSYGSGTISTGVLNIHLDMKREDLSDADFVVIEDIIDSGRTLSHLVKYLKERGANSVKTCTLLDKPDRRVVEFTPDYCGMQIPDEFVVGFGLDYDEKYRNLPYVAILDPKVYTK